MRRSYFTLLFSACSANFTLSVVAVFVPLLAYRLGAGPLEVGLVGGLAYLTYSFMPFVLGRYSDKTSRSRRGFIVLALLGIIVPAYLLYAFVFSPLQLIVLRIFEGIGWTFFWPIVDVMVSEEPSMKTSDKSFSVYNTVASSVVALGPIVGAVIVVLFADIREVFLIMAAMATCIAIVDALLLDKSSSLDALGPDRSERGAPAREPLDVPTTGKIQTQREQKQGPSVVSETEDTGSVYPTGVYMIVVILANSIRGIIFSFYPSYATSEGLSVLAIGAITLGFGVGRFGTYILTLRDGIRGGLLGRNKIKRNIVLFLAIIIAAGALPLIHDKTGVLGFISFTLVGATASALMAIGQFELIARARPGTRGRGAGLFESSIGIGLGLAPIFAGLVSGTSLYLPLVLGPLGCLLTLPLLLLLLSRGERPREVVETRIPP